MDSGSLKEVAKLIKTAATTRLILALNLSKEGLLIIETYILLSLGVLIDFLIGLKIFYLCYPVL